MEVTIAYVLPNTCHAHLRLPCPDSISEIESITLRLHQSLPGQPTIYVTRQDCRTVAVLSLCCVVLKTQHDTQMLLVELSSVYYESFTSTYQGRKSMKAGKIAHDVHHKIEPRSARFISCL